MSNHSMEMFVKYNRKKILLKAKRFINASDLYIYLWIFTRIAHWQKKEERSEENARLICGKNNSWYIGRSNLTIIS